MKKIIFVILVVLVCGFQAQIIRADSFFADGDGLSADTAYQINTCQQLQNVSTSSGAYLGKYFKLTDNVDCTTDTHTGGVLYNGGLGFSPLGTAGAPFTGSFNGNNKTITGLLINRPLTSYIGLFGIVSTSTGINSIYDVALEAVNITGKNAVGGLVGANNGGFDLGGVITNSSVAGTVTGIDFVGGLVGLNRSLVTGSHALVNVIGTDSGASVSGMAGGLVGRNGGPGTITNSYATGTVSGVDNVGGLIGANLDWSGSITNSYATGQVSGTAGNYVGGLIGYSSGNGSIASTSASGAVAGAESVGGLIGWTYQTSIDDSFARGQVSGSTNTGGLLGYSSSNSVTDSYATGNIYGTNNSGGLIGLAETVTASSTYATGNILDPELNSVWVAVGGLIGGMNIGSKVINSHSTGDIDFSSTGGGYHIGGLVGYARKNGGESSEITGSYASSSINTRDTSAVNIGGLVGYGIQIDVSTSYAIGEITTTADYVGGLLGSMAASTVNNTYADVDISASTGGKIGGLIGYNKTQVPDSVSNSYAVGNVSGANNVGGLIGYNDGDDINNCFAVGAISGAEPTAGLIGNDATGEDTLYTNNFWFNDYSQGIYGEGYEDIPQSVGRWEKASSASIFRGNSTIAPFSTSTQVWDLSIWNFPAGYYPQLVGLPQTGEYLDMSCSTVANAATYNAYPTCGVATCSAGYTLTGGACVSSVTNSSGGSSVTSRVTNLIAMGNQQGADELKKQFPNLFTPLQTKTITLSLIKSPDLKFGSVRNEVKLLQQFLNAKGFIIAKTGAGSPGHETNYFGKATRDALIKFQKANNIKPANGYFGPKTRGVINGLK